MNENFEKAVVKGLNTGGDTGAVYGFDALGKTFKDKISEVIGRFKFISKFF